MTENQDQGKISRKPQPAVGFTVIDSGSEVEFSNSQAALQNVLGHFRNLTQKTFEIGHTRLTVWGRGNLSECVYTLPDGSLLALIGSPHGNYSWEEIADAVLRDSSERPFSLPWDGRVILLRVETSSGRWTIWNDWVGSIPVFYGTLVGGRIASTLEPVVVRVLDPGENDINLPGLLALLMWGHFIGSWTLFKKINVLPPDSKTQWVGDSFSSIPCRTIQPSDQRWQSGWNDIMEEMYSLSRQAILSVLKDKPRWVLPLSSGLDSRLIAAVAAEEGVAISAYTWGTPKTSDVIHGESIARFLNIPWKAINLGDNYLASYQKQWADLFGSAMHFHGTYQMPFLDALAEPPDVPIISGFIGECMTGYDVKFICEVSQSPTPYQIVPDSYMHWTLKELRELMSVPIDAALEELKAEYENLLQTVSGPLFDRLRFAILWGRQRHFTYFQSWMSDYWRGVATPYINREYAQFVYTLPRAILDERLMQQMMLAHYYPGLASIPGSYAREPALLSGSYLLKKRMAKLLPKGTARAVFPGLFRSKSNADIQCVRNAGKASFQPLFDRFPRVANWMNLEKITTTYDRIIAHEDANAVRKLQSIQALAYRLENH